MGLLPKKIKFSSKFLGKLIGSKTPVKFTTTPTKLALGIAAVGAAVVAGPALLSGASSVGSAAVAGTVALKDKIAAAFSSGDATSEATAASPPQLEPAAAEIVSGKQPKSGRFVVTRPPPPMSSGMHRGAVTAGYETGDGGMQITPGLMLVGGALALWWFTRG